MTYVSRAQIGLRPPESSRSLVPSQVKNTAFHYPGTPKPINAVGAAGFARVCSALRGWQKYHMDSRGWSDIAYCLGIDQVGRKYTLRGINIRSAANGGTQVNLEYGAVLLILGNDEEPSAAMAKAAREVMGDYRVRFSKIPRRPTWHGAIRPGGSATDPSTICPGKRAITQIKAGKFDAITTPTVPPTTPTPPTVPGDDMQFTDKIPGMTDPDGSPVTVGEALARGLYGYKMTTSGGWVAEGVKKHEFTLYGDNGVIDILGTLDARIKALVANEAIDDASLASVKKSLDALKAEVDAAEEAAKAETP
jgi:hypothetical protein